MKEELDAYIIEGLIGIGYDLHIHDLSGSYPGGVDREAYEKERINELFASQQGVEAEAVQRCECGGYIDLHGAHQPCRAISNRPA